jgi:polyadenylate-binding protein
MSATTPYISGSLYVGDLHQDVTEPFLYEVFREVGPIASIRVCRDTFTRNSLGYAYVNFQNPVDAERALDTLNYSTVKNQPIRIMWSQRDPAVRKSGIGNVFIKNLDRTIDNKALYDTFSAFGNILSCKVCISTEKIKVKNEKGEEEEEDEISCYGFVHFETAEAAEQAIARVNGMSINGKQVYVGPFVRKQERVKLMTNISQFTNIFVKNLDKSVSDEALREMFVMFGEIQSCVIMRDDKGASKGFGFINFTDHEAAGAAVEEMNGKEVEGKKLFVGRAQKKTERLVTLKDKFEKMKMERANKYQGVNVYVKNLDETIDDETLRQEFARYGEISSCVIMKDEKEMSKGFGFVCFNQPEEAENAIKEMNTRMLGAKPLYVALAQRKEDRKQQLEQQHSRFKPGMPPQGIPPMGFPQPHVFYAPGPQQGMPQQPRGFAYPPQGIAPQQRTGWQNRPRGGAQPQNVVPGPYVQQVQSTGYPRGASVATRGARGASTSGRGGPQRNRGGADRGYKYNPTARNRPADQLPTNATPQMQQPVVQAQEQDVLSPAYLAQLNPQQQKQILGEKLFYLVTNKNQEHAPKITGMLLDMEVSDILHLLEDPAALELKITEAITVLKEHEEYDEEEDAQDADQE